MKTVNVMDETILIPRRLMDRSVSNRFLEFYFYFLWTFDTFDLNWEKLI